MNYSWSENDIYYLESLGIDVEKFDRACFKLAESIQSTVSELISYLRGFAEVCVNAFKELVGICEEFTESLDMEYKPKPRYKPVTKLRSYENPKLTYRYFHRDRFRERR